jgi:DNA-directed RNA polymerase specialized sigma24 family protein
MINYIADHDAPPLSPAEQSARYPDVPGYRVEGPSREAAEAIEGIAGTLRAQVREVITNCPNGITADEIAHRLGKSVLSIRPRVSELRRLGEIRQSGARGKNESGMSASVWVISPPLPSGDITLGVDKPSTVEGK